ncbi:MAG TPA: TetR/AcrR family transcriptional regulator [Kofleriaceae bacterium]|nr:TetR/AcrR family transcriptional regulator [Kofleriaceae bacterium]
MSKPGAPSRDERRQQLLDAARVLFSERGYHETTVDDITRAADVAKGTFYLYFSEKREIYHEVIRGFLSLIKEFGDLATEHNPSPAEYFERIREGARRLIQVLQGNARLARLAYREALGVDETLTAMFRDFYREIAELEARNIELAMQLGVVRPCVPLVVAYAHIGTVERVVLEVLERPEDFPPLEEIVDELLRIGYEGVRGPNGPAWTALFPA